MINMDWIVHMCPRHAWEAAQMDGEYRADSLASEGFIHCSRPEQIAAAGNRYYAGARDRLLLWIDPQRVQSEIRWEPSHGELFPHIYGPLNLDAVLAVRPYPPDEHGVFHTPHLP